MIESIPAVVPPGRLRGLTQPSFELPGGLRLRPWEPSDAPALTAAGLDPDIVHWNRTVPMTETEAVAKVAVFRSRWQSEQAAIWAVAPEDAPAIGLIGIGDLDLAGGSGEILYWLLPEGRGRGAMIPATEHVGRWAFEELGLHRVRITHSVANPASCRVATGAGFLLEGTMRGALLHADGWHDEHLHARLRTDA